MSFSWNNDFTDWDRQVWGKTRSQQDSKDPTIQQARRPYYRDWTDGFTVNADLLRGIWENTYPGLKLSGALAFPPIAVPLWLMGLPVPKTDNEQQTDDLVQIVTDHFDDCKQIHLTTHLFGTCWVFPFFSAKLGHEVWEIIPDETVCDIMRDIMTGEILAIVTDEQINICTGYNLTALVRRRRTFSAKEIKIEWLEGAQSVPAELKTETFRNPIGIIPIPFTNNRMAGNVRGRSDLSRILSDLKNYHDTDYALSEMLIEYKPKWAQYVESVDAWKHNNGITDVNSIDVGHLDFILNLYDKEKTEVLWPEGAHTAYIEKLKQTFWKLVQGSGIPEMLWGNKVTGNVSTSDNQLDSVIDFVEDKQEQKIESYKRLIGATARLRNAVRLSGTSLPDIDIEWNALELIPEETKSKIFLNFSNGVSALVSSASFTKEMLWKLWQKYYPSATPADFQVFKEGIGWMARHKSFKDAAYENILELQEWTDDPSGV